MQQASGTLVSKDQVVTLDYSVADSDGNVLDEGRTPISYLHGGYDDIFPGIEAALDGHSLRETIVVKLHPEEAFGDYDADLIQVEPLSAFPADLEVGMQVEGMLSPNNEEEVVLYRVTDIADDNVVLDGNHPLAGMALVFTCTVTGIRPASVSEIHNGGTQLTDDEGAITNDVGQACCH